MRWGQPLPLPVRPPGFRPRSLEAFENVADVIGGDDRLRAEGGQQPGLGPPRRRGWGGCGPRRRAAPLHPRVPHAGGRPCRPGLAACSSPRAQTSAGGRAGRQPWGCSNNQTNEHKLRHAAAGRGFRGTHPQRGEQRRREHRPRAPEAGVQFDHQLPQGGVAGGRVVLRFRVSRLRCRFRAEHARAVEPRTRGAWAAAVLPPPLIDSARCTSGRPVETAGGRRQAPPLAA